MMENLEDDEAATLFQEEQPNASLAYLDGVVVTVETFHMGLLDSDRDTELEITKVI